MIEEEPYDIPNVIYPANSNLAVGDGFDGWENEGSTIIINSGYLKINGNYLKIN